MMAGTPWLMLLHPDYVRCLSGPPASLRDTVMASKDLSQDYVIQQLCFTDCLLRLV